jgi:MinD superfamily P-loop ATPase
LPPGQKRDVRELVVISGKGGTGKTSIVASFFALAARAAVADCDVDAADLHLVLSPVVHNRWPFSGGHEAVIDMARCTRCGLCAEHCRFDAIRVDDDDGELAYAVDPISCEGCGVCVDLCPDAAAEMVPSARGEWFVSETRGGPMVHPRLGIAQENSGKLVSLVRREGEALSCSSGRELLICDGSPGIGCPVIASIAGARMVLVVTEPTLSGLHDLKRVATLTRQFGIETTVCINKADINPEISDRIEREAKALELTVLGRIRYDESVTTAQVNRMSVVENGDGPAARDIRALWERVIRTIE